MKRSIYACLTITIILSYLCIFGVEEGEKQPLLPGKQKSPSIAKRVLQSINPSSKPSSQSEKINWDMGIRVPQRRLDQLEVQKKAAETTQ